MKDPRLHLIAPTGLVVGGVLGMAGTFAPSAALRGLAWGLDGTALVLAAALLTVRHLRRGNDLVAAGFLVFVAGETLVLSGAATNPGASVASFGAGAGLWAAALAVISAPRVMPRWARGAGFVATLLFAVVAVQVYSGLALTPLSRPLPFFAYPFLVATLVGWAWEEYRSAA